MSTLVNLLLAVVLNVLGVQVQDHVQESQASDMKQIEIKSVEKINDCIEADSVYYMTNEVAP